MSDLLELMRTRRSVRQYTAQEISSDDTKKILAAALLAPSGHAFYPCEFIVVKNRETLEKLSHCRREGVSKMLAGAAAAVVVIANTEKSATIIEDCSVALMNMQLEAAALGIGSCWIQIRGRDAENGETSENYLRGILNFPENFACQSVLSLGYPVKQPRQRELEKLKYEKIHEEKF